MKSKMSFFSFLLFILPVFILSSCSEKPTPTEFNSYYPAIHKTTDGGLTWNLIPKEHLESSNDPIFFEDAGFFDDSTGIAAGPNGMVYRAYEGGNYWMRVRGLQQAYYTSVSVVNSNICYVVGFPDSKHWTIIKSADKGIHWTIAYSSTAQLYFLPRVSFVNGDLGFITGTGTDILRTSDGGDSWNWLNIGGNASYLAEIVFVNDNTGYSVGGWNNIYGIIYKTTDAGLSWIPEIFDTSVTHQLLDIKFFDGNAGMAVGEGSSVIKTTNGGVSWFKIPIQGSSPFNNFLSIEAVSPDKIFIIPQTGGVYSTIDGGSTWQYRNFPEYNYQRAIKFINEMTGFAVGGQIEVR